MPILALQVLNLKACNVSSPAGFQFRWSGSDDRGAFRREFFNLLRARRDPRIHSGQAR